MAALPCAGGCTTYAGATFEPAASTGSATSEFATRVSRLRRGKFPRGRDNQSVSSTISPTKLSSNLLPAVYSEFAVRWPRG
jgi:hypothetical protein